MFTTPIKLDRRLPLVGVAAMIAALGAAAPSSAQFYSFKLSPSEYVMNAQGTEDEGIVNHYEKWDGAVARIRKRNMPFVEITNSGLSSGPLSEFQMTIGKPAEYKFSDEVLGAFAEVGTTTPGVNITSSSPGDAGEVIVVSFDDGLMPNETVRFQVDIDVLPGLDLYPYPDYRTVFFDVNGDDSSDNSVITTTFLPPSGDPLVSSRTLPDFDQDAPVFLNGLGIRSYDTMDPVEVFELEVIPTPSGAALALSGMLVGAGTWTRRRPRGSGRRG